MAVIPGGQHTLNQDQTLRKIDMRQGILELQPDAAPITVLTGRLGSEGTHNPEFKWSEKNLPTYSDSVNNGAGYSSSATSIVVANASVFYENDTVKVPRTGEVFRVVTSDTVTNTLIVLRNVGGGAAAIVDTDPLIRLSAAMPEGGVSPTPRFENPTIYTNYTQIFKTSWKQTRTARAGEQINGGKTWDQIASEKGVEHKRDLELAFLFGKPSEVSTGDGPRRTTGGCLHFITSNITDASGTLAETTELNPILRNVRRYARNKEVVGFASDLVLDVINQFGVAKLQLIQSDSDKAYGLQIMAYQTPNGVVRLTPHLLLSENSTYNGYMIMLDMSVVRRKHLNGADTSIETKIQPNNADYREDQYLTESGLEFGLERRHGVLKGVTG